MEKITKISGKCIPLNMNNVDTDLIIPAQYLTNVKKQGYGKFLFQRLRDEKKNFVFDQEKYSNASILITKENFGCGSSREHAVWALKEAGIKAVIASSFGDIFFNNASKNQLLLIRLSKKKISAWMDSPPESCTIDIKNQIITENNSVTAFEMSPFIKYCFTEGMDDMDYLLSHLDKIKQYKKQQEGIHGKL